MHDEKTLDWYRRKGLEPPESINHGLKVDDIAARVKALKPHSWRLEGNKLIAQTEMGELINYIPTDYIMTGTDENGLPNFRKVV